MSSRHFPQLEFLRETAVRSSFPWCVNQPILSERNFQKWENHFCCNVTRKTILRLDMMGNSLDRVAEKWQVHELLKQGLRDVPTHLV